MFSFSSSSSLNHGDSNIKTNDQNISYFNPIEIDNSNQQDNMQYSDNNNRKEQSHSFMVNCPFLLFFFLTIDK